MPITPNEYQRGALRTESLPPDSKMVDRVMHAAMGFCTEAGEFMDPLKKNRWYGRPMDEQTKANLREEIGDILWYCAIACDALGTTVEEVMLANLAKLKARYPEKFTEAAALNRDLEAEKAALGDFPSYKEPRDLLRKHQLYQRGDTGIPQSILDGNGDVALGLCKVCNRGEIELEMDGGECPGHK